MMDSKYRIVVSTVMGAVVPYGSWHETFERALAFAQVLPRTYGAEGMAWGIVNQNGEPVPIPNDSVRPFSVN